MILFAAIWDPGKGKRHDSLYIPKRATAFFATLTSVLVCEYSDGNASQIFAALSWE
jgi:hypothetical protein